MMKRLTTLFMLTAVLGLLTLPIPSGATDSDGGNDCNQSIINDWGDAPEGVLAYPGVIGKFPTCRDMTLVGTQEIAAGCLPISTPPSITGHIFHREGPNVGIPSYWLGCYDPNGAPLGIDSDNEGKMNQPAQGVSYCRQQPTDCQESAFGLTWDQDECYGDGSDAGLSSPPELIACQLAALTFTTYSCNAQARPVFLNILIDMNHDGDWNDVELCANTGCVYEWAVKNQIITLPAGCGSINSPPFTVGPEPGPSWLRISLTDEPVTNDYPWAGGSGNSGYLGGETEDYPALIEGSVPALPSTWGNLKALYR